MISKAVSKVFGIAFGFFYGNGATVAYGSPKPLILVRILVPVLINLKINQLKNASINDRFLIFTLSNFHIFNLKKV